MGKPYHWTIVGAGPAGIAALGQLLDTGISQDNILWIDPDFAVGDFGQKWHGVSSNTKVKLFIDYLNACKSFNFNKAPHKDFDLFTLNPEDTCLLNYMRLPLLWVTQQLKMQSTIIQDKVLRIQSYHGLWQLELASQKIVRSQNVVLATGSDPKYLNLEGPETIGLEAILNESVVPQNFNKDDTVAVFGSSHSAVMAIKHLLELPVKKVINFYRSPLCYAVYFEDWILFDNTGLKGKTAEWAKANLHEGRYANLVQVYSDETHIEKYLPECNKAVYATGFQTRHIEISGLPRVEYDAHTGIIAPGLFGVGIAFPESYYDQLGHHEYRVGLWKFMEYLKKIMPIWLQYGR